MSGPPVTFLPTPSGSPLSQSIQKALTTQMAVLGPDDIAFGGAHVGFENGRTTLETAFAWRVGKGWMVAADLKTDFDDNLSAGFYMGKVWKRQETGAERLAREATPYNGPRENRED